MMIDNLVSLYGTKENFIAQMSLFGLTIKELPLTAYIWDRYSNYEIAFDTRRQFEQMFLHKYRTIYNYANQKYDLEQKLFNLTEEDITKNWALISDSVAPNKIGTSPSEIVNFVSTQQYSEENAKIFDSFTNAYDRLVTPVIYEILGFFSDLFMQIHTKKLGVYNQ